MTNGRAARRCLPADSIFLATVGRFRRHALRGSLNGAGRGPLVRPDRVAGVAYAAYDGPVRDAHGVDHGRRRVLRRLPVIFFSPGCASSALVGSIGPQTADSATGSKFSKSSVHENS